MNPIRISMIHVTARPAMACACYMEWWAKAHDFDRVQWIFCADTQKELDIISEINMGCPQRWFRLNEGEKTSQGATKTACKYAEGDILCIVADDVGCPQDWDLIIANLVPDPEEDIFLMFGDGTTCGVNERVAVHPAMSRGRYKKQGWFYHPDFEPFATFADEDATLRAWKDGAMRAHPEIVFEHRHPAFGKGEWDAVYTNKKGQPGAQEMLWKHHPEKRPIT